MSIRGQRPEAWQSRWRQGACPVHGVGFVGDPNDLRCPREECAVRARQWPAKDENHSFFGWLAGPDEIKQTLVKGGDIDADGPKPGAHARSVRTRWPLPDE